MIVDESVAGAKIATAKERKRSVYDARRGWSSKGFFDGRLLKILEERKGKNLTWRVFREIGATLVGFNQINLRNLNFDKKIYHILLNMGGGILSCENTVIFCLLCEIKHEQL